jgi:DnaJ homolog subfamily A member 1
MPTTGVERATARRSCARERSSKFTSTKVNNGLGRQRTRTDRRHDVVLGMEDGKKITFSDEGDQEPGLQPGDIIVVLDEKEHATFKRDKTDLHMKMQINLTESLCGFQKVITTLDNRQLVVTSLPGDTFAAWFVR